MDVGAAFPPGGQPSILVEQGEGLFDYPPCAGDVVAAAAAGNVGGDASAVQIGINNGVIVAAVGNQSGDSAARPARSAATRSNTIE